VLDTESPQVSTQSKGIAGQARNDEGGLSELLESTTLNILTDNKIDIIFLAGYLKKLGSNILKTYENRVYNIHPSLLPKYGGRGMYGLNVHTAVINAGEKETGITIHRVIEEYDKGEIIAQKKVPVHENDTPQILAARVLTQEHLFIVEVLEKILVSQCFQKEMET